MKQIFGVFLSIVLVGCVNVGNQDLNNESSTNKPNTYEPFYNLLGQEKTDALIQAVEVFNDFLDNNFGERLSKQEKVKAFLAYLNKNIEKANPDWKYDLVKNSEVISKFEESGLRKEIWLYGSEEYEYRSEAYDIFKRHHDSVQQTLDPSVQEEIEAVLECLEENDTVLLTNQRIKDSIRCDTMKFQNIYNTILWVMIKYPTKYTCISEYIDHRFYMGMVAPHTLVQGLLECNPESYEDPYCDIILVTEIFYDHMYAFMD